MTGFHPEEEFQSQVLYDHHGEHPSALYLIEFPDWENYICRCDTSYESENSGELDIDMDDPRYDEVYQIAMDIIETIQTGPRRYQNGLTGLPRPAGVG